MHISYPEMGMLKLGADYSNTPNNHKLPNRVVKNGFLTLRTNKKKFYYHFQCVYFTANIIW